MLILKECRLAMPKGNKVGLVFVNKDFNKIGEKGCEHLSRASWPQLEKINLCN